MISPGTFSLRVLLTLVILGFPALGADEIKPTGDLTPTATPPPPAPPTTEKPTPDQPAAKEPPFNVSEPAKLGTLMTEDGAILDGAFQRRVEACATVLSDSGRLVAGAKLSEMLNRKGKATLDGLLPCRTTALAPNALYETAKPSVLAVSSLYKCQKCTRVHGSSATGFAITPDTFVTNYHVVEGKNELGSLVLDIAGRAWPVTEVLAADKRADVAICRATDAKFTPIPLGNPAVVGQPVCALSHADGRFYTFTSGAVTRYSAPKPRGPLWMEISADYARGSSGGPILDSCGNVVGMVASTSSVYYNDEGKVQKDLQMVVKTCVPVREIKDLLLPSR
jgi:S1-C subfamily serine protease